MFFDIKCDPVNIEYVQGNGTFQPLKIYNPKVSLIKNGWSNIEIVSGSDTRLDLLWYISNSLIDIFVESI